MIDICQWRGSIGLWCYHKNNLWGTSTLVASGEVLPKNQAGSYNLMSSLVVFPFLLLILSGDIELNPGPKTGI